MEDDAKGSACNRRSGRKQACFLKIFQGAGPQCGEIFSEKQKIELRLMVGGTLSGKKNPVV
jgi:hypothetical protein